MIQFTTPRCTVRWIWEDDLSAMHAVYGDAETVRYVGDHQPLSPEQCRRWLQITTANYAARGYGMYAIVERGADEAVGFCGVVHPNGQPTAEIKYAFRRDAWGRGLASEIAPALLAHAFGTLGLERIIATVDPDNTPSIRTLERAGLRYESTATHEDGERTATYGIERRRTALVLVDVQANMFDPTGPVAGAAGLLARLRVVLAGARAADVPVVLVRNTGGPGDPDEPHTPGWELHEAFVPQEHDLVIDKATADAFAGTALEARMRARGVERIVLAGLQSEHCIRATALGAIERGFAVVLVSDGHSTYPAGDRSAEAVRDAIQAELADRVHASGAAEVTFA